MVPQRSVVVELKATFLSHFLGTEIAVSGTQILSIWCDVRTHKDKASWRAAYSDTPRARAHVHRPRVAALRADKSNTIAMMRGTPLNSDAMRWLL